MLIGIDGACKWGGTPECVSCGVAFVVREDGHMEYKSIVEDASTSQRGELNGLICALTYAKENCTEDKNIVIVTDSEYLYNSVEKEWYSKWKRNNWVGASGPVANVDKWISICDLLEALETADAAVAMQWTKGHLISGLTPGMVKSIMRNDPTGIALYSNIQTLATRVPTKERLVKEFNDKRLKQGCHTLPEEFVIEQVCMNVTADLLAGYIKDTVLATGKF